MTIRAPTGVTLLALWRRIDLRRLVLGDPALKAAALTVAVLLSIWASAVYNAPAPEVTLQLDGRVPIERPDVPTGYVLRGAIGDVAVKLRGPEDAARAVGQQQVRATLDLSTSAPSPDAQPVPVRVSVSDDRVRVVEISPATIPLRLERRATRVLPVQARFANDPPSGFQAAPATFRPQEVTIAGPESVVARVVAVLGVVRFGDAPLDLAQDVRPVPVDAQGAAVDGLEVDPVAVRAGVPVLSTATTRTIPVLWQLRGEVASGYWISKVATDPVAVTVSGARDQVAAIERIDTVAVNVGGLSAARSFTASLVVPAGVTIVGEPNATVSVTVVALVGSRPFPLVAVQTVGLGAGLVADVQPGAVDVTLSGTVASLVSLGGDIVSATVDIAGLGPGAYTLEVSVRAPAGTSAQDVRPARVTVTIRSTRPTPSPTATP